MKTIEDIKEERTFYKREKDIYGNVTRTPYQKLIKREPKVVSPGVRFGYYLIDVVVFYLVQIILGIIIGLIAVSSGGLNSTLITILNILPFIILFLYYSLFEAFVGGSVGKLICGYVVIDKYAERIKFTEAMLRTICRFVPFEAFSCFGDRGWHDKWSNTYVVKKTEQLELQRLLGNTLNKIDVLD